MNIEMGLPTASQLMFSGSQMFQRTGNLNMVMIRPPGKAKAIAVKVMKGKGIKVPTKTREKIKPITIQPFLQN